MREGRTASVYQMWSKSVKLRPRYGHFWISQDGGRRHLGFFKFQIFKGQAGQEVRIKDHTDLQTAVDSIQEWMKNGF